MQHEVTLTRALTRFCQGGWHELYHSFRKQGPRCVARPAGLGSPRFCYLGHVHRAPRRSVWPLLPGGLLRGARLSGACFMFPPRFHVPCWPRSYYTGACSPPPCSQSIASLALSVAVVPVKTLPPVPLVSDTPFPALLAWEDWVREICQQRTHWRCLQPRCLSPWGTIHISRHSRGLKHHGRSPSCSEQ